MVILLTTTEHEALKLLWTIQRLSLTPALKECLVPYAEEIKSIEFHGLAHAGAIMVPIDGSLVDVEYYEVTKLGRYVLDDYEDFSLSEPAQRLYNKILNKDHAVVQIYQEYSELLTKEDVTAWYAGEFETANNERNQLKEELAKEKQSHEETHIALQNYTHILDEKNLL